MGKGTIYLMGVQIVFLFSSYIVHFGLGRYLGPELYGTVGIILSFFVIYRTLVESGIYRAVSKFTAQNDKSAISINNQILKLQLIFSLLLTLIVFVFSPQIAVLLKDFSLIPYIRMSALFIPGVAIYAVYLGSLNGIKAFDKQAKVSFCYQIAKPVAVFTLVFLGLKIFGAIGGYILATFMALIIAQYYWRKESKGKLPSDDCKIKKIITFAIPVTLFFLAFNLITNLDLFFVKAILGDKAETGFYTSAAALSKIPYFIFLGLSETLFPSIAKLSSSKGTIRVTRRYISQSLRYSLLFLLPLAFMISATSKNLISLMYTDKYIPAASSLSILIFGLTFLSLFITLTTIITASGKPWISLSIASVSLGTDIFLNVILVPVYRLTGAAAATTITCFMGMLIAAIVIYRKFHTLIGFSSFIKIIAGSLVIYAITRVFSSSGIFLLLFYGGLLLLYFALLYILKEIKREDIQLVKDIFFSKLVKNKNVPVK